MASEMAPDGEGKAMCWGWSQIPPIRKRVVSAGLLGKHGR
jgi:hypothetical protein